MEVREDIIQRIGAYFSKEIMRELQEEDLGGNLCRRLNHIRLENHYPH